MFYVNVNLVAQLNDFQYTSVNLHHPFWKKNNVITTKTVYDYF